MKYLKKFENAYDKYLEINDIVILIKDSHDSIDFKYKIGDLCRITSIDKTDVIFPYEIENITNSECYCLWVEYNQIRKADDLVYNQYKFNL